MVFKWEPQTPYGYGSVVEYEGIKYKIVQPHTSQSDWTPPATPALWSRLPEEYSCPDEGRGYHEKVDNQYSCPPEQQVQVPHEEQQKKWYDIDDKRKKELEVGGGLLLGAGLLAGGFMAYKHHHNEEEKKQAIWDLQTWMREAQARTDEYYRNGSQSPVTWVLNKGRNIPKYAIEGGQENGEILYVSRAFGLGGVHPGKCGRHLSRGASIATDGHEVELDTYEVLIGKRETVRWVRVNGHFSVDRLEGCRPVEGGREADGTILYISQAFHEGSVHPGKVSEKLKICHFSHGGKEKTVEEFGVLVYN